jgi:hypothetical protein
MKYFLTLKNKIEILYEFIKKKLKTKIFNSLQIDHSCGTLI